MSEGTIVGLDNLNDYYDPSLKDYRLSEIEKAKPAGIEYEFVKGDLADRFTPKITLREGLRKFAEWYKSYYCSDV